MEKEEPGKTERRTGKEELEKTESEGLDENEKETGEDREGLKKKD